MSVTIIEVVLILLVLYTAIVYLDFIGAIAASIALLIGRIGANLFLLKPVRNARAAATQRMEDAAGTVGAT